MAVHFIRIPLSKQLSFPDVCPFSGKAQPRRTVRIWHPAFQLVPPIPIIAALWRKPVTRVPMPTVRIRAWVDKALRWLAAIVTVVAVGALLFGKFFLRPEQPRGVVVPNDGADAATWRLVLFVFGGFACAFLLTLARRFNLRAVRIIDAEPGMAELQFTDEAYARRFAELNGFVCHERPFKERHRFVP